MRRYCSLLVLALGAYATQASAGILYAIDDQGGNGPGMLYTIDPGTLAVTLIGSTGQTGQFGAIAYDSGNGKMYFVPGRTNDNLFTINLATGLATLVGSYGNGVDMNGLAYDPTNDKLFGFSHGTNSNLYTLNQNSGAATLIASTNTQPGENLAFNTKTNQLILLSSAETFYSVSETTAATNILGSGNSGGLNVMGVTYDPTLDSYWVDSILGKLNLYSATTYAETNKLTNLSGAFDEIAYVGGQTTPSSSTPEPATFYAPLLLGLAWGGRRMLTRVRAEPQP